MATEQSVAAHIATSCSIQVGEVYRCIYARRAFQPHAAATSSAGISNLVNFMSGYVFVVVWPDKHHCQTKIIFIEQILPGKVSAHKKVLETVLGAIRDCWWRGILFVYLSNANR